MWVPPGNVAVDDFRAQRSAFANSEIFLATGTVSCILGVEFGAWLSPVERLLREQEAPGSNPGAPTIISRVYANLA